MHFHDDALFPENQDKLVITAAPYGPEWEPADFPEDLPVTMDQHVQAAVDCYNAGATVLHIHVRELDGKGSKRLSKFNELLGRLRDAVPDMILQIGGSISFSPEGDGADAKWLSDDTRHMLADLDPAPDQVTIAINTNQMNIVELMTDDDIAGTSIQRPEIYEAYRNMYVPADPAWVDEHLTPAARQRHPAALPARPRRAAGNRGTAHPPRRLRRPAQPHLGGHRRRLRRPQPVQHDGIHPPRPRRRHPHPGNPHALRAAHQHHGHRHGPAHPLRQRGQPVGRHRAKRLTSVHQIEQLVQIADVLGRKIADGKEARDIYRIGQYYDTPEETLAKLGYRRPTANPAKSASPSTPDVECGVRFALAPHVLPIKTPALEP